MASSSRPLSTSDVLSMVFAENSPDLSDNETCNGSSVDGDSDSEIFNDRIDQEAHLRDSLLNELADDISVSTNMKLCIF